MSDAPSSGDVLEQTARGTGWVIGWRLVTRLLGLVNTLILVRILLPGDFGLVALATSFSTAVETLGWIGLQDSLVREKTPTRSHYDTAFTLGLIRALITALLVAGLAVPAGSFFGDPRLTPIAYALAGAIALDGLGNVGAVDFRRDFAFQKEFVLWVLPRIASVVISISVAVIWQSYWALVAAIVSQRVLRVALSYVLHPYRARLHLGAWREILGYSSWAWVLSLMSVARDRTATVLIGRMLGATPVGIFSLGLELASLPTTELVEPLGRVAFSAFSATRNHGLDGGQAFLRMVSSMALLTIPAGVGMALIADPVVRLAFGPRWAAAVPLVQMLGVCGALTVFGTLGSVLFRVYGEQRKVFHVSLAVEGVRVLLLIVLTRGYGLIGAGVATAVAFAIEQLYFLFLVQARFAVSAGSLIGRLWRPVFATSAMSAVLLLTGASSSMPVQTGNGGLLIHAAGAAAIGALVYVTALFGAWGAVGRPDGAEADILTLFHRTVPRSIAKMRARFHVRAAG